jgi:hypothetical protein
MGKSSKKVASASSVTPASNEEAEGHTLLSAAGRIGSAALMMVVAFSLAQLPVLHSSNEGRCFFLMRFLIFMGLEGVIGRLCAWLLLMPARAIARRLPGAVVPATDELMSKEEHEQHDPSLQWPVPGTVLPPGWAEAATKPKQPASKKQPYFLNHVRGAVRLRQAALRLGAAVGMVIQVHLMSRLVDNQPVGTIGLDVRALDVAVGMAVGSSLVLLIFLAEVGLGWLKIVGYAEVVVPGESLTLNLLWDVLFHVGVSVQEELSLRGWMCAPAPAHRPFPLAPRSASCAALYPSLRTALTAWDRAPGRAARRRLVNMAQAVAAHTGATAHVSMASSVIIQAALFAVLHLGSPGASVVGLTNLVVGGVAGALNVFVSGSLSFGLGWHFGWNLWMGHLLGMSTSGIPMSAKLVSVVPHPHKARLHGGRFGPEQSPLAQPAYLIGIALLLGWYGTEGLEQWSVRYLPQAS